MNVEKFTKEYLEQLKYTIDNIDTGVIRDIVVSLDETIKKKSRVYILGNGGSSATASHMVNDLGAGLRRRDIINWEITLQQ